MQQNVIKTTDLSRPAAKTLNLRPGLAKECPPPTRMVNRPLRPQRFPHLALLAEPANRSREASPMPVADIGSGGVINGCFKSHCDGRDWDRTSDLPRVKRALSR